MTYEIFQKKGRRYVPVNYPSNVTLFENEDAEDHALGLARHYPVGTVVVYRGRYMQPQAFRIERFAGLPSVTRVGVPAAALRENPWSKFLV